MPSSSSWRPFLTVWSETCTPAAHRLCCSTSDTGPAGGLMTFYTPVQCPGICSTLSLKLCWETQRTVSLVHMFSLSFAPKQLKQIHNSLCFLNVLASLLCVIVSMYIKCSLTYIFLTLCDTIMSSRFLIQWLDSCYTLWAAASKGCSAPDYLCN